MNIIEILKTRRSIRKFEQTPIPDEKIRVMLDVARLAPSGANLQPIRYIVVNRSEICEKIFPLTKWAAYLGDKGAPKPGETPTAYIVVLADTSIRENADNDASFAVSNIVHAAWADGIGSCIIASVDRSALCPLLNIEDKYEVHSLVALGYPKQTACAEDMTDSIRYYLDEQGVNHVPKRKLNDIVTFF